MPAHRQVSRRDGRLEGDSLDEPDASQTKDEQRELTSLSDSGYRHAASKRT